MRKFRLFGVAMLLSVFLSFEMKGQFKPLKPEDPIESILTAYDSSSLVAFGERHGVQPIEDFYLSLLDDPRFLDTVDDIVIEFGNSLYQEVLDRYVNGESVPYYELKKVWLNHTNSLLQTSISRNVENLINKVRTVNEQRTAENRIRILAGDPPVDWERIQSKDEFWPHIGRRDRSYLRVVWNEVIDKQRKAFMIMGRAHFKHVDPTPTNYSSLIQSLENRLGKPVPVIHFHHQEIKGFETKIPFISRIQNTEIGNLRLERKFQDVRLEQQVDAIMYFGQNLASVPSEPFDAAWIAELDRRSMIVYGRPQKFFVSDMLHHLIDKEGVTAAKEWFESMLKTNPERYDFSEFIMNYTGYEFLEKNNYEAAIMIFSLNARLYPDSFNAHDSLAEAYNKGGHTEKAIAHYEKSLELNPDNENARKQLQQIKGR